jgi:hypothetical protein
VPPTAIGALDNVIALLASSNTVSLRSVLTGLSGRGAGRGAS